MAASVSRRFSQIDGSQFSLPGARSITGPTDFKTKIVCTLGPASNTREVLEAMVEAGMDVVRLNFSHGTHEEKRELFKLVRSVGEKYEHRLAIMCDIQGPKIRTGTIDPPFFASAGATIKVCPDTVGFVGNSERISIQYETMLRDLDTGDLIYINDGVVRLVVHSKTATDLVCKVEGPGHISTHKGCNIPSGNISLNVITEKDREDLKLIAELDPEFVAASFIGTAEDVKKVRTELAKHGNSNVKIISKIERPVALTNIDSIIHESDYVMVARGDLGVEIPAYNVPSAQKMIVRKCNNVGRPVIVATQMLESMIENVRPTRAEASDVFNAVLDGADAVMLSGETSVGKYPVEAVRYMDQIVAAAEDYFSGIPTESGISTDAIAETMGHGVHTLANSFKQQGYTGKILSVTTSGTTAKLISKFRPALQIIALTPTLRVARELSLVWGVHSIYMPDLQGFQEGSIERRWLKAVQACVDQNLLNEEKDHVICVSASQLLVGSGINMDPCCLGMVTGAFKVSKMLASNE